MSSANRGRGRGISAASARQRAARGPPRALWQGVVAPAALNPTTLASARRALLAGLSAEPPRPPPSDLGALYELVFGLRMDPATALRLARQLARGPGAKDKEGFVYAFVDERDIPPNSAKLYVKIGYTRGDPAKRIAKWRDSLGDTNPTANRRPSASGGGGVSAAAQLAANGPAITSLFAYECKAAHFCETLIHTALTAEHVTDRVDRATNRRLTEYFLLGESSDAARLRLKVFVKSIALLIDERIRLAIVAAAPTPLPVPGVRYR